MNVQSAEKNSQTVRQNQVSDESHQVYDEPDQASDLGDQASDGQTVKTVRKYKIKILTIRRLIKIIRRLIRQSGV